MDGEGADVEEPDEEGAKKEGAIDANSKRQERSDSAQSRSSDRMMLKWEGAHEIYSLGKLRSS